RSEIMQIVGVFRANIVDVAPGSLTVEVTGDEASAFNPKSVLPSRR
ncbi:MAG: hypothetical protein KAX38_09690, partial [Candidatus Krumholzibacteria bacterium]|nr:hypothetical protein [Candidatus Krumholzibacteria bacterium]